MLLENPGNFERVEVFPDDPRRWTRPLDFGNELERSLSRKRGKEVANQRRVVDLGAEFLLAAELLRPLDFPMLRRHDLVKYGGHDGSS